MSCVVSEANVLFDLEYPSYVYGPPLFTFDVPLHTSFHVDAFMDDRLRENNLDLIVCYYMGLAQKNTKPICNAPISPSKKTGIGGARGDCYWE